MRSIDPNRGRWASFLGRGQCGFPPSSNSAATSPAAYAPRQAGTWTRRSPPSSASARHAAGRAWPRSSRSKGPWGGQVDLDVPDPDAGCSIDGVADSANTLVVLDHVVVVQANPPELEHRSVSELQRRMNSRPATSIPAP